MIGNDGEPRIKLYHDDQGRFRGEALVMYFKEGSVSLAITLLDDTELEMGSGNGNMRVREAVYERGQEAQNGDAGKSQTNASAGPSSGGKTDEPPKKKAPAKEEKFRITKRIRRMQE